MIISSLKEFQRGNYGAAMGNAIAREGGLLLRLWLQKANSSKAVAQSQFAYSVLEWGNG